MEVVLSPKYQLLVPKNVRKELSLRGKQKFQVITKEGMIIYIPDQALKEMKGFIRGLNIKGLREESDRI